MDESALKYLIRSLILTELAGRGLRYVPAAVSARHVQLSRKDMAALFCAPGGLVTPAATDRAKEKRIVICRL
jgi:propanediol utilization protein